MFYVGSGEDYEGGDGPHALTVRAGDGPHTVDATVTVTVTDEAEAPGFGETSYAFVLAENVDGSETRVSLGTVEAEDPDGDTVSYAIAAGNESGRFVGSDRRSVRAGDGKRRVVLRWRRGGLRGRRRPSPYALTVRAATRDAHGGRGRDG